MKPKNDFPYYVSKAHEEAIRRINAKVKPPISKMKVLAYLNGKTELEPETVG